MKWLLGLFMLGTAAQAQQLKCTITHEGKTTPMFWYAPGRSHHADISLDLFTARVQEKEEPGKFEILISEATEDAVWDKLVEVANKSDASDEMKKKLKTLGRTRLTRIYVGLYEDLLLYEHRLGNDPISFTITCVKSPQ